MKVTEKNKRDIILSLNKTLNKCFELSLPIAKITKILIENYGKTPDEYHLICFWDMTEVRSRVSIFTMQCYTEFEFDETIKHFELKEDYEKCELILSAKLNYFKNEDVSS